jgi:hypothetical protein
VQANGFLKIKIFIFLAQVGFFVPSTKSLGVKFSNRKPKSARGYTQKDIKIFISAILLLPVTLSPAGLTCCHAIPDKKILYSCMPCCQ